MRHDSKFERSAPLRVKPVVGPFDMLLGVGITFIGLLVLSVISPTAAAYVGAAILALIFARLLYGWLNS